MAITTMAGLVAALPGQRKLYYKPSQTSEGAGTWHSLWAVTGTPDAGATPATGAGAVPTSTTTGAIPFTNPTSGNTYLARFSGGIVPSATFILYDRLWHNSGLSGTSTLPQLVGSSALTRPNSNGDGVELWGEVYTAMGAVGSVFTASYTNSAGTISRSATYTMPANALSVGQMFPFTLQAGDTGVRSVATLTLSISTGTAGNFGLTLLRRVVELPAPSTYDFATLGLPQIYDNACLAFQVMCLGGTTIDQLCSFNLVQG